ncbi:MAG: methyltransferase domain-containing protein [Erysipelotrichaceae bacterium]|nr:methyltransferase domain-containing protein [Erysipelotrichaceae bacterium]
MNRMNNYLHGTDIWLYQRDDMFRVNTDTYLLGMFLKVFEGETVLDIGTNNGALLLYASRFPYRKLIGVDIFPEAIELAEENLKRNQITEYELYAEKIQNTCLDPVDVILSNPPYFPVSDNTNLNPYMNLARHEIELDFRQLCEHARRLAKPTVRWYLVHRASRLEELKEILRNTGWHIAVMQLVYDQNKTEPVSVLMECRLKPVKQMVLQPITLTR